MLAKLPHQLYLETRLLFQVETIEGFKDLYIPPGTQPGEKLKFAQLGAPDIKKPNIRGDHNFVIKVKIPKNIRCELQRC